MNIYNQRLNWRPSDLAAFIDYLEYINLSFPTVALIFVFPVDLDLGLIFRSTLGGHVKPKDLATLARSRLFKSNTDFSEWLA